MDVARFNFRRAGILCLLFFLVPNSVAQFSTNHLARVSEEAWRIHRSALVIDGHNDFPWEMRTKGNLSFDEVDISKYATNFHTDIGRLKLGGMGAQFWAIYVPARLAKTGGAARQTLEQVDFVHRMMARYPETFALALNSEDVRRMHREGKIASLMGIEGGHSIENSLGLLRSYYQLGVRYMTLTHSDSLSWADAATDKPVANGLNDFGRQVIAEMNRLGMLVDISHVSPATMHAALDVSKAPIIASHSGAFAVAQHPRNVPDDVLARLKENGGVVMINFYSGFLVPESAKIMAGMFEVSRQMREKFPEEKDYEKAMKEWHRANPMPAGTAKDLVNHIDHVVKVAGIDHVGLGSDFDGVSKTPSDLPDVSSYPVVTQELLDRGYKEADIKKVLGENMLRVMAAAEKVAAGALEKAPKWALVIHGGVGTPSKAEMTPPKEAAYREKLSEALEAGKRILAANGTSLDAVVAAIEVLEDSPLFNAGKGSALNRDGVAQMDASIMDGATIKAGAVAGVKRVKNPIEAARRVMDKTKHVLVAGADADLFAESQGLTMMPLEYFVTPERRKQLEEIQREEKTKKPTGTVGAVALDQHGNLAAGTSTGGLANKLPGRVGDSPIIGAGTFAENATCAVSGTGQGEFFIRAVAAHEIAALMKYKNMSVAEAAETVVKGKLTEMNAEAGIIALDRDGNMAMPFNTEGMFRGSVSADGAINVLIY